MRTAVITIAAGRITHLRKQFEALTRSTRPPEDHIVVSMGDPEVLASARSAAAHAVWMPARAPLPLAAARNLGAATAIARGADLLVFLDVDCMPDAELISYYRAASAAHPDALLCGPVTYLPAPPRGGYNVKALRHNRNPHPGRPAPPVGDITATTDYHLFWSLSFALRTQSWHRIAGFDPAYRGYGGEDTDFGLRAAAARVPMHWVGGAHAYHQYHPVSDPPVEHLHDILTNARLFHRRWGTWPMRDWLDEFTRLELVEYVGGSDGWIPRTATAPTPDRS